MALNPYKVARFQENLLRKVASDPGLAYRLQKKAAELAPSVKQFRKEWPQEGDSRATFSNKARALDKRFGNIDNISYEEANKKLTPFERNEFNKDQLKTFAGQFTKPSAILRDTFFPRSQYEQEIVNRQIGNFKGL